jgi:nitrite reductase/ring-hydroxylating ferredoxin subunit/uncharacterized membrane protein
MRSNARISSHPIHPMLVALPLGLWIGSWVFDVIGSASSNALLSAASFYCAVAGICGAVLAAIPGAIDWLTVVPPNSSGKKRGAIHGSLNVLILIAFLVIAFRRGSAANPADGIELTISTMAIIALGFSGWLGGTLAYRNQIGIDRRYAGAGQLKERTIDSWERPVCNQSELGDGQVMLAKIQNERVVVARCSDGMVAFSDHCTHKGGPLSDGALVGCTVQCPWHGSQFDVRSGRVVAGPAGEKIKTYDIEIRGGEVYVKPAIVIPGELPEEPKAA